MKNLENNPFWRRLQAQLDEQLGAPQDPPDAAPLAQLGPEDERVVKSTRLAIAQGKHLEKTA